MPDWQKRKAAGKVAAGASYDRPVTVRPITTANEPSPHRWRAMRVGGTAAFVLAGAVSPALAAGDQPVMPLFHPTRVEASVGETSLCDLLAPRIEQLRHAGEEDGVVLTDASHAALRGFVDRLGVGVRPSLTLRDDGALRALWKSPRGEQLSVKFVAEDDLHVALILPRGRGRIGQWVGYDDADGVVDLLYGHDVPHLLFG